MNKQYDVVHTSREGMRAILNRVVEEGVVVVGLLDVGSEGSVCRI